MSLAMPIADHHHRADPGQNPAAVSPTGRLRHEGLTDGERNYAMAIHLTTLSLMVFFPLVLTPLVLWLIQKDKSSYADDHGREVVNMLITGAILGALSITIIIIPLVLIWSIFMVVNTVRGAIAASNGEYFRYPMIFRFL